MLSETNNMPYEWLSAIMLESADSGSLAYLSIHCVVPCSYCPNCSVLTALCVLLWLISLWLVVEYIIENTVDIYMTFLFCAQSFSMQPVGEHLQNTLLAQNKCLKNESHCTFKFT